jgi:hypothetical protein
MGDRSEYNRRYYLKHREKIVTQRRRKYLTDADYADRQRQRSREDMRLLRARRKKERIEKGPRENVPSAYRHYTLDVNGEKRVVKMYRIGALGTRLDRKRKTLLGWEADGILPEAMFRDSSNRRLYSEDQVNALVAALKKVLVETKGHKWKPQLRDAFFSAWKTMPKGIKEDAKDKTKDSVASNSGKNLG